MSAFVEKYKEKWNKEKDLEIIEQIQVQIRKFASAPYEQTLNNINWELISAPGHTPSEIKEHFHHILSKQRSYRLLTEILEDMETKYMTKCGFPEDLSTFNAFTLFCKENNDLILSSDGNNKDFIATASKLYKELTMHERQSYRRNIKLMLNNQKEIDELVESIK